MADDILKNIPLPADLPENWTSNQIIAPTGAEAGLDNRHGYNYLMKQVNNAQKAATALNEGKLSLSGGTLTGPLVMPGGGEVVSIMDNAATHNMVYRGKALGGSVTSEQWAAIKAGTFKDLYLGDYWSIGGVNYLIAGFDYWLNTGDTPCTKHHVVVIPQNHLYTASMNETNTTEGGYVGSQMYKTGLDQAKQTFANAFGAAHILNHREWLVNAVSNGLPSGGAWFDSTIELPNENMMYGSHIFVPASDGITISQNYTVCKAQLQLFHLAPQYSFTRSYWCWLRDAISATNFDTVYNAGNAGYNYASAVGGVRPVGGIC